MSDIKRYIDERSVRDPDFAEDYDLVYSNFKIGVLLRQAREAAGMTQEQVARQMGTRKSAISRMENHAEDVRLSTLRAYAQAIGAHLHVQIYVAGQ
jgi:HTH-type transcriptional regulator / antitoxin HipB